MYIPRMAAETLLLLRSLTFVGLMSVVRNRFMLVNRDVIHGACRWLGSLGIVNFRLVDLRLVNFGLEVYRLVDLRLGALRLIALRLDTIRLVFLGLVGLRLVVLLGRLGLLVVMLGDMNRRGFRLRILRRDGL